MKKRAILPVIIALTVFLSGCAEKTLYPTSSRDTIDYFGNGRFIISAGRALGEKDGKKVYQLWDQAGDYDHMIIEFNAEGYLEQEPYVYCVGDYYTRLNYIEGVWQQAKTPAEFEEAEQEIFSHIEQRIYDHYQRRWFKGWRSYPRVY